METVKSNNKHFFRKLHLSPLSFSISVLLFVLPFVELQCGSVIIRNSGVGIAAGSSWKEVPGSSGQNEIRDKKNDRKKVDEDMLRHSPNIFALVALTTGLFGVAIYFARVNWKSMASMCAGILGAVMLIAMMVQLRMQMRGLMERIESVQQGLSTNVVIGMKFTIWYYVSLIAFVAAAFFSYMQERITLEEAIDQSIDFEFQRQEEVIKE